ncbi:hypothetical protein D0Z03_000074 [Geotrichum reessii]|nr:hypothetical protein D0Z03_000074 [Galactomyces reessii]
MSFLKFLQRSQLASTLPATRQFAIDFARPNELKNILVRSDQELDGFSTATLDLIEHTPPSSADDLTSSTSATTTTTTEKAISPSSFSSTDKNEPSIYARFHGVLNLDLPKNRPDIVQSGYAMFRTRDQQPESTVFPTLRSLFDGNSQYGPTGSYWDWSSCSHLLLKVKGDRRKYFVNIQAESALPTDIYQHRLFLKTPGQWEKVYVPLKDFILTNWGVIQEQRKIDLEHVKTIGIGLIDKQYGPFDLSIASIEAVDHKALPKEALLAEPGDGSIDTTAKKPIQTVPGQELAP